MDTPGSPPPPTLVIPRPIPSGRLSLSVIGHLMVEAERQAMLWDWRRRDLEQRLGLVRAAAGMVADAKAVRDRWGRKAHDLRLRLNAEERRQEARARRLARGCD